MSIIYNSSKAFRGIDSIETSGDGMLIREHSQHLFGIGAKQYGSTINSEQIISIELSDKRHKHLFSTYIKQHSGE